MAPQSLRQKAAKMEGVHHGTGNTDLSWVFLLARKRAAKA